MTAVGSEPYKQIMRSIWERDSGRCGLCGEPVGLKDFHADHIIHKSKGGSFTAENLRPTHPLCNRRRGARDEMPDPGKRYVPKGKKILITLDEIQLAWLDDVRFQRRFDSRSAAVRWMLDQMKELMARRDKPEQWPAGYLSDLDDARRAAHQPAAPEGRADG